MNKVLESLNSWRNSLLDTTKRNRAINFRKLKRSTIDVVYPSFVDFLTSIENKSLEFVELFDGQDTKRSQDEEKNFVLSKGFSILKKEEYNKNEIEKLISNFVLKNKTNSVAFSSSYNDIQRAKLRTISNQARLFEEENALNVLYIAVGMLEWFEDDKSNVMYRSPIMFLPASLTSDSIKDPFKLKLSENDIIINDSLIRFMYDNFKYDLSFEFNSDNSIFENYEDYKSLILEKIKNSDRWNISDEINISTFKFNNINMVKDLEENESEILNHNLIKLLAGETIDQSINESDFLSEEEVDRLQDPNDFYQSLDSDSSQSVAVAAAVAGKSFVLQGPPGTGKSQTITNIITELIARNKKVLFVAEKKAALDVVHNNLKSIKLSDYALTLHNTSLDKKETITELANSLLERQGNYKKLNSQTKQDLSYNYLNTKSLLNEYGKSLINIRKPLNKSVYDLYGQFFKLYGYSEIRFNIENIEKIDARALDETRHDINALETLMKTFNGNIKSNPWYGLKLESVSYRDSEKIDEIIKIIKTKIDLYNDALKSISNKLNTTFNNTSIDSVIKVIELINSTKIISTRDANLEDYYFENDHRLTMDINHYENILENKTKIKKLEEVVKNYDLEVLSLNVSRYYRIASTKKSFFSRVFSKEYKTIKKELFLYQQTKINKYKDLVIDLSNLKEYKDSLHDIKESEEKIERNMYSHLEIDELSNRLNIIKNYNKYINLFNNSYNSKKYKELLENIRINQAVYEELNNLDRIIGVIKDNIISFSELYNGIEEYITKDIELLRIKVSELANNKFYINEMAKVNELQSKFKNKGLSEFFNIVINNKVTKNLVELYLRRHYYILINYYIENDEILAGFNSSKYSAIKDHFKDVDNKLITTTAFKVKEIVNKNAPNINGIESNNPEVQRLLRENNKKRRIMPIRRLFNEIPNLILKLKPVLMMSPLSVSTFLRTSDYKFDVVIFDEASQVYPENAIGALYRSKQFIIVGDSNQLPPTSFFRSIDSEDDEQGTDVSDFESILDIASSALQNIQLKWHYRSKFEELITPSNREIYGNLLTTFPQPLASKRREGLEFDKVNGLYQNNTNLIEAERVVDLIFEHFDEFGHDRSLGVVTFNKRQTSLIEDVLLRKRREVPEYEEYFSYDDKQEPFFIKNLENVQGDERDTMIMSVTYGPNSQGRVLMNFGPINNVGGNRRLNVAITRAKFNLIIVSSITHDDIDLSRTSNEGPVFLKQILKYAELGFDDKVDAEDIYADFDSPFEEEVYREIINLGYKVNPQVGSSGFKIDLGVLDPNNDNKYILGIECDGASYHSSTTARERDRLRQDVLEARGWKIYRIWSTDWFNNKEIEIKKLKETIENAKNNITYNELHKEKPTIAIKLDIVPIEQEEIFDQYPNYEDIAKKFRINDRINFIDALLEQTTPIHFNELRKFIPLWYGRKVFNSYVKELFIKDLRNYKINGKYRVNGKYVETFNQKYDFRTVEDFKTSRDFINMHIEELKNGIIEIIKAAEQISIINLQNTLRDYSGYQSISSNIRDYINKAVKELLNFNKITINENEILEIKRGFTF